MSCFSVSKWYCLLHLQLFIETKIVKSLQSQLLRMHVADVTENWVREWWPASSQPALPKKHLPNLPKFQPSPLSTQSQPLVLHKLSSPCLFIEFALRVTSLFAVRASSNLNCSKKLDFDEGLNLVKLHQWIIIMQLEWYNFPELFPETSGNAALKFPGWLKKKIRKKKHFLTQKIIKIKNASF